MEVIDKLKFIKAFVYWGEEEIPADFFEKFPKIYKFKDFLLLGHSVNKYTID